MRKWIVATLLIALGLSVTASAVTLNRWENTNVSSAAAALAVVRGGTAPNAQVPLAKIEWTDTSLAYTTNYYVGYVTGFLVPPADGVYTFYVASDDNSSFALSPNADIAKAVQICSVSGYTGANAWTAQAGQKSAPQFLQAGQFYAFYMVMNEGTGGDNGSVGWTTTPADVNSIQVIDGQYVQDTNPAQPDALAALTVTGAAADVNTAATLRAAAVAMYPWNFGPIEWYKQGGTGTSLGTGGSLAFTAVTDANEGSYYCVASGVQSPDAVLDVRHGLVHRYTFNEADVDLVFVKDVVNQTGDNAGAWDGILLNNTGKSKFENGKLVLGNSGETSGAGTGDYVDLPNGILTSTPMTQMTVVAWITPMGTQSWQRIWDFGTSDGGEDQSTGGGGPTSGSVYVASRTCGSNGYVRMSYRMPTVSERHVYPSPTGRQLPLNQEVVITAVWDEVGNRAKLYVNGIPVGHNTLHMKLSDLTDNNCWIGRSQYNDTLLVAAINEFRIYDKVLPVETIARQVAVGPDDLSDAPAGGCTASGQRYQSDLNGDCVVDLIDYAMMVERWMNDVTPLAL